MIPKTNNEVTSFHLHSEPLETFETAFQCQLQVGLTYAWTFLRGVGVYKHGARGRVRWDAWYPDAAYFYARKHLNIFILSLLSTLVPGHNLFRLLVVSI